MDLDRQLALALVIMISVSWASSARAQVRSEEECLAQHPGTSSPTQMAECTSDIQGSRRELDGAYTALLRNVDNDWKALLAKSQESWLVYRDAKCAFEGSSFIGNTGYTSDVIACTAAMNRERAAYLIDDLRARWSD